MKFFIQLAVGGICAAGALVTLYFMITSEMNFKDLEFAKYFSILGIVSFIAFIVLMQNTDNEETNPTKEKK